MQAFPVVTMPTGSACLRNRPVFAIDFKWSEPRVRTIIEKENEEIIRNNLTV